MSNPDLFYVYVIRDPRPDKNLQPIYVGKGSGKRLHLHWKHVTTHSNLILRRVLSKIHKANLEPTIEIISYFKIEADAFALEIELITKYGRRNINKGPLCNLTDGGEGISGSIGLRERLKNDSEFAKTFANASSERLRKLHSDPVFAKAHAKRISERNTDPNKNAKRIAKLREKFAEPEFSTIHSKRRSEHMLSRYTDPAYKEINNEHLRKQAANPELRAANAERARKRNADPKFQAKAIAAQRAYWAKRKAEKTK